MSMRVVSVFGPFQSRALVDMSVEDAAKLVPDGALGTAAPSRMIDAVQRDLEALAKRDEELAASALAMSALAMAFEIEHPYNSATSKSMCQARLADALRELRQLAPPVEKNGRLHDIKSGRSLRLASGSPAA